MNKSRLSQKKPHITMNFVRRVLYLTCMKNRITRLALTMAIARATKMFQRPRSTVGNECRHPCQDDQRGENEEIYPLRDDMVFAGCCRM